MDRAAFEKYCKRWEAVRDKQVRTTIAQSLGISDSNLDRNLGIITGSGLSKLFPTTSLRKSSAASYFDANLKRYKSISDQADAIGTASRTKKRDPVAHLREASVVLAMGSVDAYIRNIVIERSIQTFFNNSNANAPLQDAFVRAIRKSIADDPNLIINIALQSPADAKTTLAERVFELNNVRILTGSYAQLEKHLGSIGLDINSRHHGTNVQESQFWTIAPIIFDSFSNTRHQIVHTGGRLKHRTGLYCSNQEPQRFLGSFLEALVTMIEIKI